VNSVTPSFSPLWKGLPERSDTRWRESAWSKLIAELRPVLENEGRLFDGKTWRLSPTPFLLPPSFVEELEWLGRRIYAFQRACNQIYRASKNGRAPEWIAHYADAGKPAWLLDAAESRSLRRALPLVLRPDLVLTESGYSIAEIDSVPGGIGLTAFLNATYAKAGFDIIGGETGMLKAFAEALPKGRVAIAVSDEAATYRPEMEWIAGRLKEFGREVIVISAEKDAPPDAVVYRFYELFDLPNLPGGIASIKEAAMGTRSMTPPPRPHLEEKMWLALLWSKPLEPWWHRILGARYFQDLRRIVPRGWVMDPAPLPHHAGIPGLDIADWQGLKAFSQRQRQLVLKQSGFSAEAWGARSVVIGHDEPHACWSTAVDRALEEFPRRPWVLQEFSHSRLFDLPVAEDDGVEWKQGRVRLCPYYFVVDGRTQLAGALATFCPPDKKILHGMQDAVMVPCAVG